MQTFEINPGAAFRKTVTRLSLLTVAQLAAFQLFGGLMQTMMVFAYCIVNGDFSPNLFTNAEELSNLIYSLYSRFPYSLFMIFPYILSFAIIYGLYARSRKLNIRRAFGRGKLSPASFLAAFLLVLGMGVISDYITRAFLIALSFSGLEPVALPSMSHPGIMNILSITAQVVILPALMEEYAYRGVSLLELSPFGKRSAVLISALLFSLMHATAIQIPNAFLLGILMAYLTLRLDSIWIAVFIHFVNNALSIAAEYLTKYSGGANWLLSGGRQTELLNLFMLAAGVIGILILRKSPDVKPPEVNAPSGAKALFSSWGFYALLLLSAFFTAFSLQRVG